MTAHGSAPATRRVRGDGVELAVYERGRPERPVILLVHGYPDTHAVWDDVAALLAADFQVIAYDVRGAGSSSRPKGTEAYRFQHLIRDLYAVPDHAGVERPVHLVGHDWGSIQGWEAVAAAPERFASFTSISGPCLDHVGHWVRTRRSRHRAARLVWASAQLPHSWYIGFFQLPALPELVWRSGIVDRLLDRADHLPAAGGGHFGATVRADGLAGLGLYRANMAGRLHRPRPRRIDVPVRLIVPVEDPFVTPSMAEEAPRPFVTDLRVRRVRARHWVPVTHPGLTARLIAEHVREVGERPGTRPPPGGAEGS